LATNINWRGIVFWVLLFAIWYCWPTEGWFPTPDDF